VSFCINTYKTDRQTDREKQADRSVGNLYATKMFPEWCLCEALALCVLWVLYFYSPPLSASKTGSCSMGKNNSRLLFPARNTTQ